MIKFSWGCLTALMCCVSPALGQTAAGFTGKGRLLDIDGAAIVFSGDNQTATVLYDSLVVAADRLTLPVATKTLTVSLPLAKNTQGVRIKQFVRGFAWADGKAKVALVVQAGGKTTVVDLLAARDPAPKPRRAESVQKTIDVFVGDAEKRSKSKSENPFAEPFDYTVEIPVDVPAKDSNYLVTFILIVQRRGADEDSMGMLTVDTLDVAIVDAAPPPAAK